jgi:hypothetical protein
MESLITEGKEKYKKAAADTENGCAKKRALAAPLAVPD